MLIEPVYDILNLYMLPTRIFSHECHAKGSPFSCCELLLSTTKALKDSMTLKVHFEESFNDSDKLHKSTIDEMTKCHPLVMLAIV